MNTPSDAKTNRLIHETSPYLQQHARNPVDWYPWGPEAISAAKSLDRPIFLSIGYSACHWCHVMEHESFEEAEIAGRMNDCFINIKVDREERPDLDQIYMTAVQALTGRGGWPMSVFLTPNLKPFFGGTYWPPNARMGMPGFRDIVEKVHEVWESRRSDVFRTADELTNAVRTHSSVDVEPSPLNESILQQAMSQLLRSADREHGGFGRAPKFPHPMDLQVLLRMAVRFNEKDAQQISTFTLDKMARGGIYDHLGGGFHRYSTDAYWLAPHFEKMLYDNALLVGSLLDAFQLTGDKPFAHVVRETCDYVLREMTLTDGGFCATQDADSEGEEGKYFVWSQDEVLSILGTDDGSIFCKCYDVTPQGNWEGKTILNRNRSHVDSATTLNLSEDELDLILARCRKKLFDVRSKRIAPGRDDKVLVSWNGLMISALARAGRTLDECRYTTAAVNAASFLRSSLVDDDNRLMHSYKDGQTKARAFLDDYACLINGLVDLYQTTFDASQLDWACALADQMLELFEDRDAGGFFYTPHDHETLITRQKDSQDGATPSGNGMAVFALLRLGRLCSRENFTSAGVKTLELLSGQMARVSLASGQALMALDDWLGPSDDVIIVDGTTPATSQPFIDLLRQHFLPHLMMARKHATSAGAVSLEASFAGKSARDSEPTVYICQRGICQEPITQLSHLKEFVSNRMRLDL
ncbi:MAG: thioredoxin domain-containing protein [Planctomycetota bacterium]|nr:thioredoxin domain-containing protein [Planctomycetota bacterium]MDA1212369.1 thioredoxin domain-containing protein [Planctomycetota bacterium]